MMSWIGRVTKKWREARRRVAFAGTLVAACSLASLSFAVASASARSPASSADAPSRTALATSPASAGARSSQSDWYWTAGKCKFELSQWGVLTGDSRYFNPAASYCVGLSGCSWNESRTARLYREFLVVVRSFDGVVRRMDLEVTGESTWSARSLKLESRHMSADQFTIAYRTRAHDLAASENTRRCEYGLFH
jgi:hypothetical protein